MWEILIIEFALALLFIIIGFYIIGEQKQISATVKGKKDLLPIEYVSIILIESKTEQVIDNVLTDYQGRFLIKDLGYGTYYITCVYPGYKKLNTQPFAISLRHRAVNLGVITLENE